MTHKQHPLGTPFPPASTAHEVLAGIDLTGRNAIVTGGHAGIGLEVTRALSRAGASVTVGQLDLVDPRSIDTFAAKWLESGRPLHLLINGAGASGGPERDARGYETQFATNHLGHFQLTLALLPALRAAHGARVVNVSSGAHRFGRIRWTIPTSRPATTRAPPTRNRRPPTCCSRSSSTPAGRRTASAASPCIRASSSAPSSTVRPVTKRLSEWG